MFIDVINIATHVNVKLVLHVITVYETDAHLPKYKKVIHTLL